MERPVEDWPLAVADGSRVPTSCLVETDHVRREFAGSNFNLLPSEELKWHYLSRQGPEDILLLKNFDSSDDVRAKRGSFLPRDLTRSGANTASVSARVLSAPKCCRRCSCPRKHRSEGTRVLVRNMNQASTDVTSSSFLKLFALWWPSGFRASTRIRMDESPTIQSSYKLRR